MNEETSRKMNESEEVIPVNCAQFEASIYDLDRDLGGAGTWGMELREAALVHAESCGRCAQLMNDVEALDFSLERIAVQDAPLQAPPRVEAALLQEFRAQKEAASRKRGQWRMGAIGIAAMVLLTAGVSMRLVLLKHAGHAGSRSGADSRAAGLTASNGGRQSGAGATTSAVSAETEVADNLGADNPVAESTNSTAFVALPYATDPGTLEGGTVVRVELSRAGLASMGMPVTDAGSFDRIPADIMLSEDGAPQAIRLVSTTSFEQ